jgi:hypothetical protein
MKRKLILHGQSSLTVSLPRKFVIDNNLTEINVTSPEINESVNLDVNESFSEGNESIIVDEENITEKKVEILNQPEITVNTINKERDLIQSIA